MAQLHVLRVFVNDKGEWGNPLGVFLAGAEVPEEKRQVIAAELGFSETVYVEDRESGSMRIFTPAVELPFAGHPSVGTAWLLREQGHEVAALRPPAGKLGVRVEGDATFVSADPAWCPPYEFVELDEPASVHDLSGPPMDAEVAVYAWTWIDEDAGTVRARCFADSVGIPEDEATGSAALPLSARLGRELTVTQGRGSLLVARPLGEDRAEVGGRVVLDETRGFEV